MVDLTLILFVLLMGSVIGSFLNVVIDRLPRNESFFTGRSYCEECKKPLQWFDLVPLLSFLSLLGKCRYCKKPIPMRIFIVELLVGISFVMIYILNSTIPLIALLLLFVIFSCICSIFFIDLRHRIIPDVLLIILSVSALLFHNVMEHNLIPYLTSGVAAFLVFLTLFLVTKGRGMGFGDVKFSFVIGLLLGFPNAVIAFYAAFLTGAIISVILILGKRKRLKGDTIAFGPFLIVGIGIGALFSNEIIRFFF